MMNNDFYQRHCESIIESSDDAIISKSLDGRLLSWNQGAERIFGYTAEEMIGNSIHRLLPHDRQQEEEEILARIATGMRVDRIETIRVHKDGSLIHVSATISPIFDQQNQVVGASKIARDITRKKQTESELALYRYRLESLVEKRTAELHEALDKAQTAARSKTVFLANMSHEIRTPLNAIIGITNLLKDDLQEAESQVQLGHIESSATHLLQILNDILDLSKVDSGKISLEEKNFNLSQQCQNIHSMFVLPAKMKGITFEMHMDATLESVDVIGDPLRISQIIINLLSNAIKFTPADTNPPGIIQLNIRQVSQTDSLVHVAFEVKDQGIGIDPAFLQRIFGAFEQADASTTRQFGGTGLGLAISMKLADLMGGDIKVWNNKDKGSCFQFTLPLKRASTTPTIVTQTSPLDFRSDAKILLVDDNELNLMVAKRVLAKRGFQITTAENGEVAVDLAAHNHYDLILMDMQMPIMDGVAAAKAIRASGNTTPIIAMTANAFTEDKIKCTDAGMNDHIPKPVTPELLYTILARYLMGASNADH